MQIKGFPIAPLTGLLDTRSMPDLLPLGALRWRLNWQTAAEGKLRRGCGWPKALNQSGYNNQDFHDQLLTFGGVAREPVTMLFESVSGRGIRTLWAGTRSRLGRLNETTGNWKIIGSGLGGGVGEDCSGIRFKCANVGDYLLFTNNHDRVKIHRLEQPPFDSTLLADVPDLETIGLTKAAVIWAWKDIIFLADVEMDGERFPNRIVWGDVKNPPSFDPAKPESIAGYRDLNYGERVLAALPTTAGTCLIYTTQGIWEVSAIGGAQVFQWREAYPGIKSDFVGVLKYENTLVDIGGEHLFMSKDGIYSFSPYRTAPELVPWLHRASARLYEDLDELDCAAHLGFFHNGEAHFSVKRVDEDCPGLTMRIETTYKVVDYIDHGFSAAVNFRSQPIPSIRDFILDYRICTLAGMETAFAAYGISAPFANEGLPAPFATPTAAFTPTVIHTDAFYMSGGTLISSGAGTAAANGEYLWNYSLHRYEKANGYYISTVTDGTTRSWKLYSDTDVLLYTNTAANGSATGAWTTTNGGTNPRPTVLGDDQVTVTEDFERIASDSDSLCALLDGLTIDDLCRACEQASRLIVASSSDWCLKQFELGVNYRERCVNPTAVGTTGDDGYTSAIGSYILDGYDSILRFAPMFTDKALIVLEQFKLKGIPAAQAEPSLLELRIGISGQTADPNDDRCLIVWHESEDKELKCLTADTASAHRSKKTSPAQDINWRFHHAGKNVYIELKITGTGGDCTLSGVIAEARAKPIRNY